MTCQLAQRLFGAKTAVCLHHCQRRWVHIIAIARVGLSVNEHNDWNELPVFGRMCAAIQTSGYEMYILQADMSHFVSR